MIRGRAGGKPPEVNPLKGDLKMKIVRNSSEVEFGSLPDGTVFRQDADLGAGIVWMKLNHTACAMVECSAVTGREPLCGLMVDLEDAQVCYIRLDDLVIPIKNAALNIE